MFRGQLKTLDNLLRERRRHFKGSCPYIRSAVIDAAPQSEHFERCPAPPERTARLCEVLRSHFLFAELSAHELDRVVAKMLYCRVAEGQTLFEQHSLARYFFVIDRGEVSIVIDGCAVKAMAAGSYLGDLALLYNTTRSAAVRALEDTWLWALDGAEFKAKLAELKRAQYKLAADFIEKAPIFAQLTGQQKGRLCYEMLLESFPTGAVIVRQGEAANALYIIVAGRVEVLKDDRFVAHIEQGSYFGENAILEAQPRRSASVLAVEKTDCYSISRQVILELFGRSVSSIVSVNRQRELFAASEVLRGFSDYQVEQLIREARTERFEAEQVVAAAETRPERVYLLLEGKWSHAESVAGDAALVRPDFFFAATVVALTGCLISSLEVRRVHELFGPELTALFARNAEMDRQMQLTRIDPAAPLPSLDGYEVLRRVGEGNYGTVFAAEAAGQPCALKVIPRFRLEGCADLLTLRNERDVMARVNSHKIVGFLGCFKSPRALVFALELVEGLPFEQVLVELDLFDRQLTAFFAAQLVLALQYLHLQGIVYRDLKPDNLLCRPDGYLKLVDLGSCKQLQRNRFGLFDRTFTVVGTAHYMAPELIAGAGYTFSADYWSLGVMIYEMMAGVLPFGADCSDPLEVYQQILREELVFPEWFEDAESRAFVTKLLRKKPEARAGSAVMELVGDAWFAGIDWYEVFFERMRCPRTHPARHAPSLRALERGELREDARRAFAALLDAPARPCPRSLAELWETF